MIKPMLIILINAKLHFLDSIYLNRKIKACPCR